MKLQEAIKAGVARKHIEGPVPGAYIVSKANLSAGYYKDFKADDPARRSSVSTSSYWGYDYPGADPLTDIAAFAGEDGWQSA